MRICDICGRGPKKSAMRSHSNTKTLKRQYLNLQSKKVGGQKIKICTSCIRTASKEQKK